MNKRKLILHIGMHKTGTTSIQRSFSASHDVLLKYGINYLKNIGINHSTSFFSLFTKVPEQYHINLRLGINTPQKARKYNKKLKEIIVKEFEKNYSDIFIISGEDLSILKPDEVETLYSFLRPYFDDINVICYIRDPVSYYNSAFQQRIVGGQTFSQLYDKPPMPFYRYRIEKYAKTFGINNLKVRVYDRKLLYNGDIIDDFLVNLGLDKSILSKIKKINSNESRSMTSVYILEEINKKYPPFIGKQINQKRGHLILKAFTEAAKKTGDPKFIAPMFLKEEHINIINNDIEYINKFLPNNKNLNKIILSKNTNIDTSTISIEFVAELVNKLQLFAKKEY